MCNKRFFQTARHLDHLQKGKSVRIKKSSGNRKQISNFTSRNQQLTHQSPTQRINKTNFKSKIRE